jgi:isopropylmalate/homocitrate/citramalate synthase
MNTTKESKHYRTSEYNSLPEVRKTYSIQKEVYIVDSTIRSLQAAVSGGYHTVSDLIEIGKALDSLGVRELYVNLVEKNGVKVCEGLSNENLQCKVVGSVWGFHPYWRKWVEEGIKAGVDEIAIGSAVTEEQLEEAAEICHKQGKGVSHEFSTVYSYEKIVDFSRKTIKCGYKNQSFHDSFSLFKFGINPEALKYFISSLRRDLPGLPPVYVHFSNFFGHATMLAAAAVVAGATAPDVSMNGIGHHGGHIPLEEIVMVLECWYGINTGIKLEMLHDISLLIQKRTGIPVAKNKPIVGEYAFLVDGFFRSIHPPEKENYHAVFPVSPAQVGSEEKIIWVDWVDKEIFPDCVEWKLSSMGLQYQSHHVENILKKMEEILSKRCTYPKWLTDSEFEEICRRVILGTDLRR